MKRILGVGIATLDIVNRVDEYPAENAEVRVLDQRLARGGNCTNTLAVLCQFGYRCDWGGLLGDDESSRWVAADLTARGIRWCVPNPVIGGRLPTSYVTLSQRTGSRTIVHYRDLREYADVDLAEVDLQGYDWVHFEGRNVPELGRMMRRVRDSLPGAGLSLEIEKPRDGLVDLASMADLVLFSRDFAQSRGYADPATFLASMATSFSRQRLFCGWGERGAAGLSPQIGYSWCDAVPPALVVDTLGAGDVFNAAVIHGTLQGDDVKHCLQRACVLAAQKCGQAGLDNLVAEP